MTHDRSLHPPNSRHHHLRASVDLTDFQSPLSNRTRPSSEIFMNTNPKLSDDDISAQSWLGDLETYQSTLEAMANVQLAESFKGELAAVEQWFRLLSEAERTAALYAVLQQKETTQVQTRFFITVLQRKAKQDPMSAILSPANYNDKDGMQARFNEAMDKLTLEEKPSHTYRPNTISANVNRPSHSSNGTTFGGMFPDAAAAIASQRALIKSNRIGGSPARASLLSSEKSPMGPNGNTWSSPVSTFSPLHRPKSADPLSWQPLMSSPRNGFDIGDIPSPFGPPAASRNWASMVNTPVAPMFSNQPQATAGDMFANATAMKLAALSTVNQRVVLDSDVRKFRRSNKSTSPASAERHGFSGSASGLQGRQSPGPKGPFSLPAFANFSSPQTQGHGSGYDGSSSFSQDQFGDNEKRGRSPRGSVRRAGSKPPEDPTDPALLKDIPAWLRSLRLHKYTDNLKDLPWQKLIELNDEDLDARGVNAMGARRKLLKVLLFYGLSY